MKRTAVLPLIILFCSAIFLFAGDKNNNKATEMTGWVCSAKCVDQSSGKATCNPSCSAATEPVVFISEQGEILKIANQEKAQPMAGKHCKMTAKKNANTGELDVQNMVELRGP